MTTTIDISALATGLETFVGAIITAIGQFLTAVLSNTTIIFGLLVLGFVAFIFSYAKRKVGGGY